MGKCFTLTFFVLSVLSALCLHAFLPDIQSPIVNEINPLRLDQTRLALNKPLQRITSLFMPLLRWAAIAFQNHQDQSGNFEVSGIDGDVKIQTDVYGVPHVFAKTKKDVYFGQGYIHGHERLWQMTLSRYVCSGRLSELFGTISLNSDVYLRLLGFSKRAEREDWTDGISEKERANLEAYLNGINAYINNPKTKPPIEYTILGLKLQNFTMSDLICNGLFICWQMTTGWNHEVTRGVLKHVTGDDFEELEMHYPEKNPTILERPYEWNIIGENYVKSFSPFVHKVGGSNSWAVSGKHTKSGNAMICNDPHIPLRAPSFWHEIHLHSADGQVSSVGVSIPGLPGVAIGCNGHFAWGYEFHQYQPKNLSNPRI